MYYLVDPTLGTGDWQEKAISYLELHHEECFIACPAGYTQHHPLWKYRWVGDGTVEDRYSSQTSWEIDLSGSALFYGCLVAWLSGDTRKAGSSKYEDVIFGLGMHYQWFIEDNSYAESRGIDKASLMVIGIDESFHRKKQMEMHLNSMFSIPPFPVPNSLEATMGFAVNLMKTVRNKHNGCWPSSDWRRDYLDIYSRSSQK